MRRYIKREEEIPDPHTFSSFFFYSYDVGLRFIPLALVLLIIYLEFFRIEPLEKKVLEQKMKLDIITKYLSR